MRIISIVLCLFCVLQSAAIFAAMDPDERRIFRITRIGADVVDDEKSLIDPRRFAEETFELEKGAGRKFSEEEIIRLAKEEIRVRGHRRCFTGDMRVLTPTGYVEIKSLKVGDQVISWDVRQGKKVVNRVKALWSTNNVEFGRLSDLKPEGKAINSTKDHPFYSVGHSDYIDVGKLNSASTLMHVRNCEAKLVSRGAFEHPVGRGTVFTLSLEFSPNNFIVEGILVHNKPGHIT